MKKILITFIIAVVILSAVGCYALLNEMFPLAEPIKLPSDGDIISVTLMQKNDRSTRLEIPEYSDVMRYISECEPTRKWSIQDYPDAESYYTLEIESVGRLYRLFVYREGAKIYIESPYEGVYASDGVLFDELGEYFAQ